MAVPDDQLESIKNGDFRLSEFLDWRDNAPAADREYLDAAQDNGLSLEWAALALDSNASPDPNTWDHVTIERQSGGAWGVIISDENGPHHVSGFQGDEVSADLIWRDLWLHVIEPYAIPYEKDIESP